MRDVSHDINDSVLTYQNTGWQEGFRRSHEWRQTQGQIVGNDFENIAIA